MEESDQVLYPPDRTIRRFLHARPPTFPHNWHVAEGKGRKEIGGKKSRACDDGNYSHLQEKQKHWKKLHVSLQFYDIETWH